jgi:hypothetical protein
MHGPCFFLFLVGWDWVSWYCGHYWPTVPAPDDRWGWLWRNTWNEDWQGKPKYSEKTCPSATLSTKNLTWVDTGLNPGRRGGKPATNRLSYGAARPCFLIFHISIQVLLHLIERFCYRDYPTAIDRMQPYHKRRIFKYSTTL